METAAPQMQERAPGASRWTRLAAVGLVLGSGFLLARTIMLMAGGSLGTYSWWAAALLGVESSVDAVVVVAGGAWLVARHSGHATLALRAAAAMILMHAVRVLVFVLGRTGPWVDFDVRPPYRADYATTWSWFEVWFAGTGAALSVILLAVVWRRHVRNAKRRGRARSAESGH